MKLKPSIYLLLLLSIPICSIAKKKKQQSDTTHPSVRTDIGITLGKSSSNFRDFATSPLIYQGLPTYVSLSRFRQKNRTESALGLSYSFGNYGATVGNESASSNVKIFSAYYSKLYPLDRVKIGNWQTKVGGLLNITSNTRINSSLGNNALGLDVFGTLFGSINMSCDISRRKAKDKKFIFIPYHLKPRTRTFNARLNIGLMNTTYRNGFAYIGQSGVLNESKLFDGYQFKAFSGLRLSTSLDYTIFLNNNAVRLSYSWDAYKTGGDLDKFEMAHHLLGLTFLLNTKQQ